MSKKKTYFEVIYGALWDIYLAEIQDLGIKGCLSMLKDYLVDMLEEEKLEEETEQ